ncbi:MAG: CBS domain-containing protein [Deltaproteobacteria bacterium]|nr:CBS domain-containing protein [Deltaproteobacteria bacterium]
MKVRDLMTPDVITLDAASPLVAAEELMGLRRFRHLPVTEGGRLIGLVTHRDLLRAYVSSVQGADWRENERLKATVNVAKIMHTKVRTIGPDDPLTEAARLLRHGPWGCLPVVDEEGHLVGILTEADFVRLAETWLRTMDPSLLGLDEG